MEIWVGILEVILNSFGNLWNAEPHKHIMPRGCSSSINFLQWPNIFIQWWESDWVTISDVHSKYCMWKSIFRWRPCFIHHSTCYFFYRSFTWEKIASISWMFGCCFQASKRGQFQRPCVDWSPWWWTLGFPFAICLCLQSPWGLQGVLFKFMLHM